MMKGHLIKKMDRRTFTDIVLWCIFLVCISGVVYMSFTHEVFYFPKEEKSQIITVINNVYKDCKTNK